MTVDAQHPIDLGGNLLCEIEQRRRELAHLRLPGLVEIAAARGEQHFRLEDEAVADDADVFPVGKDLTQAPEEIGTVAVELLHALRQRDNQAAAEKSVWENALLSQCQTVCDNLTKLFQLNKAKAKIMFDASNVSALVANEKDNEELIKLQLENIAKMREIAPNANIDNMINDIIKKYETRK